MSSLIPLRISPAYLVPFGLVLVLLALWPLIFASVVSRGDWAYFVGGGATVGTPNLVGPNHVGWETAHGAALRLPWDYPPAVAFFYAPFARVSLEVGFWLNAAAMALACVVSGVFAARIYRFSPLFSVLAVLAWAPALLSASLGQNSSLALLFYMLAIWGIVQKKPVVTGVAVGLLLFKPTDAVTLTLLLILWRKWRAVAVVAFFACLWYVAGVPAAGGDWSWPYHDLVYLAAWYPHQEHSQWFVNLSAIAMRLGAGSAVSALGSLIVLGAWLAASLRAPILETASCSGLVAVAVSPHANPHDVALLVPALFYVMCNLNEPWRDRIVLLAYGVAGLSTLRTFVGFDPVTIVVLGGIAGYLAILLARRTSARQSVRRSTQ